ncbi:PARP14 [Branchiostoma lanceolatum]|uniref:PARP14 protein n=1 Tax=Branchiostoma lanceolatum TaxID=7740 RepID=A0A8J9W426_BRALA|nr:PARP14 [Branchiostoma lanceolatum]
MNKHTTARFSRNKEPENNLKGVVSCRQIGLSHRMYFEILTSLDTKISIYQGDVIKECVDVIVNETNDRLKLSGELSWALAQYGGHDIEADCRRYVATHGRLTATQVVPTSAGQLPSKHILHAVVPPWVSADPRQSKMLLYKTYENIFKCAAIKMRVTSIALSLQTSGSTGIPKDVYAETMFQAVVSFLKTYGPLLRDIRMVNPSHRTVSTFIDAFKTKMPLVNFVAESRRVEKWH